jgi:hypothetical protein
LYVFFEFIIMLHILFSASILAWKSSKSPGGI